MLTFIFGDNRKKLLKSMPKGSVCAEIGVWKGEFSKRILDVTKPSKLHLIDPWAFQPDFPYRWYGGTRAGSQEEMDVVFEGVRERFSGCIEVKFHRDYSDKAASEFPDEYFDWIYIDGNHDYEFVKKDLEAFLPKVKDGGFLTGDDYLQPSPDNSKFLPVKEAVSEFVRGNSVELLKLFGDQFIIRKAG
jgi:hypothetical protein